MISFIIISFTILPLLVFGFMGHFAFGLICSIVILFSFFLGWVSFHLSHRSFSLFSFFSSDIFRSTISLQGISHLRKKILRNFRQLLDYKIFIFGNTQEITVYPPFDKELIQKKREKLEELFNKSLNHLYLLEGKELEEHFNTSRLKCYAYSYNIPLFNNRILILSYFSLHTILTPTLLERLKTVNDMTSMIVFLSEVSSGQQGILKILQEVGWESPYAFGVCNPKGELLLGNDALYQMFRGSVPNFQELCELEIFLLLLDGKRIGKTFTLQGRKIRLEAYPLNNKNFLVTKCIFLFFDEQIEVRRELLGETNTLRRFTSENPSVGAAMFTIDGTLLYSNEAFMKNLYIFKVREAIQKNIYGLFRITEEKFQEITHLILEGKEYECSLFSIEREQEFLVRFKGIVFGDKTIVEVILNEDILLSENVSYLDKETQEIYEELQTARSVQEHILALPTIYRPGIGIDTLYIPSRQLSGDFFTVIPFNNDQMGFLIADVSGHGVSASLITAALKILIEFAPSDANNLPKIIDYFNVYLADILPEGSFVTLFYGIINFSDYSFRYINCGHPFPILEDLEFHETKILDGMGFPLGGLLNVTYDDLLRTIQLPKKSKLFFYTDGILQHLSGSMKDKLEKMCGVIQTTKATNDKELLNTVYKHLVSRNSTIPEDDVSMMLVSLDKTRTKKHHLYIPSTIIAVDSAIMEICRYIQEEVELTSKLIWKIHTCFYEALLNAVVHGNKYNTQKKVYIDFRIVENLIVIRIRDEGSGFDFENISNPFEPENILKDFGRGITMIKTLADRVKFNKKGNEITLFFLI